LGVPERERRIDNRGVPFGRSAMGVFLIFSLVGLVVGFIFGYQMGLTKQVRENSRQIAELAELVRLLAERVKDLSEGSGL
jgi:cell division protein FtsB